MQKMDGIDGKEGENEDRRTQWCGIPPNNLRSRGGYPRHVDFRGWGLLQTRERLNNGYGPQVVVNKRFAPDV